MGQLVTTIVGGTIGFLIGGPAGAALGMSIGGMIGATLFGPTIKGPRLNDLKVTASTYGVAIPEIYGTVRLSGNIIWTSGIKETKKTRFQGKGGPRVTTYTYDASFAAALCKGPITSLIRIWADSKLIYDGSNNSSRAPLPPSSGSGLSAPVIIGIPGNRRKKKRGLRIRLYKGDEDQLPDSLIEADKGVGNVSAHRGLAYVVFERMPLEDYGNRIPQLTFEISKAPQDSYPSIVIKDGPGGVYDPTTNRVWRPDWESGRLFSSAPNSESFGNRIDVFDLATMKHMQQFRGETIYRSGYGFSPAANLYVYRVGLSNSSPLRLIDLRTGRRVATYGVSSNSLSGIYFQSGPRQGELHIPTASGHAIGFTEDGRFIVNVGLLSAVTWILSRSGTPVGFYDADWKPLHLFPALGSVWGWRNTNDALQIGDFMSGGIGQYTLSPPDSNGNVRWRAGGAIARNTLLRPIAGQPYFNQVCLYDPSDRHFFCLGWAGGSSNPFPVTFKYNPLTGAYKFIKRLPEDAGLPSQYMEWSRIEGGTFGWLVTNRLVPGRFNQIDLQTGDFTSSEGEIGSQWGSRIQYRGADQHWDDLSSSIILTTADTYRRVFFNKTVSGIRLSDVVRDIATKSGVLTDEDIDVTGLVDEEIIGFSIDRESSAKDALKMLATGYMFDGYESDYKLKFRTRGRDSETVIPLDWIARKDDEAVRENLVQELEMPLKVTVNFYDTTRDHQQGSQSSRRNAGPFPTMWTSKEDVVELPIVWTPDMAKQCADKLLKMAWANRTGLEFSLPWRYLKYDPSDVLTLNTGKAVYVARLTETQIGQDYHIEIGAVSEKGSAYFSSKSGSVVESPAQTIDSAYPVYPVLINTPLLRDEDYSTSNESVCYLSAGTDYFTFTGATLYLDEGIDPTPLGSIENDSVMGTAINALPYTTAYEATDEKTVLRVRLKNPEAELESVTQLDMLNYGLNAALVGEEVIQFREAVQQADGEWWLTGLRRARRGTNYALRSHQPGEHFLMLEPQAILAFDRPPEAYVTTRGVFAVSSGQDLDEADTVFFDLQPRDLMPYTPEDIRITDDGADVTITASRRSRITAPLRDGVSNIHFKEGAKQTSRLVCKLWPGIGLESLGTGFEPSYVYSIPLFDENGEDIDPEIIFPLSILGTYTKFLACLSEQGVVDGIPKWVVFERIGEDRWNQTEFY